MKQGRRMRTEKTQRIENAKKVKLTPEQIKAKKKKIKRVFLVFAILIALIVIAFIANDFIIVSDTSKTNLVINNNNITSNLKKDIIIEEDIIYLSTDDIKNFFDKYIYLEEENNKVITTYDKKIASIGFEEKSININGSNKRIYAHAKKLNDTIYLPISEMKDVYGIDIEYIKDSNTITMDSTNREQKKAMVAKDAAVKARTGFISETVDRIQKGKYVIVVSKTNNGLTKIRTANGRVGYVKNDCLANEVTIRENMEEEKQINGKVNLVWDYYSEYGKAPDRSNENIEGINVVSPAFFYINSKGEFKENVGSAGKNYIEWAHKNGYKVWPMVSNSYETNMLEPTSKIMNSYEKRQELIEKIVDACVEYKIDGINIDFENMKKEDKDLFSRFIIELTPRMKEAGLVTTVDVTAPDGGDTWSMCFDRNVIGHVADYIVFMAYDEYTSSGSKAGTTAGYNWVETNLNKFLKTEEIESDKIILAVPLYTVLWTEDSNGKASGTVVSMKKINEVLPDGVEKQWLQDLKQNYVEYQDKGETKKMWIEDLDSIKEKLTLVIDKDLGGVAAWAKDREDPKVWEVIKNSLNK